MTAFGMAAIVLLYPSVKTTLGLVGAAYLLYLAFKIANAPLRGEAPSKTVPTSFWMGFLVGVTNRKAYIAQTSLVASFHLLPTTPMLEGGVKWAFAVTIMTLAGFGWL